MDEPVSCERLVGLRTFEGGGRCPLVGGRVRSLANNISGSGLEGLGHGIALQWGNFHVEGKMR